ncbi:ABC transporter ATP-binding protein [Cryptosporangium aurantiacum]|uniref:ABC-2 type transport system ATP-binding protein n=1 Tax=Cryptosporangium aurantiacum TaxID=134849 RepID=A0A1M7I7X2_9ACTN|nr:ABC transporter ATP-binding protein [Cryptosporangium aurantiacum]SHM36795.1 ABC-2 type transport system ATP-binding protein [Cryptosporangium aurantiacum]
MEAAVAVSDLVVERGKRRVLHGVNFSAPSGTVIGLLGPSGCGKTTLMRCLVGVQKIRSGTVTVLGEPAGSAPLRRRVGYLTQQPSVYGDLTVRENTRYFAAVLGVGHAAADQAIADVGLATHADQLVGALSGGQHARASLACALLGRPEVLVLDEPTVGQDPVLRQDLWQQFHQLAADGTLLVVSSHVMDEAGKCDRLLLMRDGRFVADAEPAALRADTGTDDLEEAFLRIIRANSEKTATEVA